MKKKLFITTGSLLAVSLPLSAVVSCGTSWHKWNRTDGTDPVSLVQDPQKANVESYNPNKPKDSSTTSSNHDVQNTNTSTTAVTTNKDSFAIRDVIRNFDIQVGDPKLYDAATKTVNLNEIKNQFELNMLLAKIIGLNSPKPIETYWRSTSWPEFTTYLQGIEENIEINLKYTDIKNQEHTTTAKWDITDAKQEIIDGLTHKDHFVGIETDEQKYYDATNSQLTEDGFTLAKNSAVELMSISIVNSLTSVDLNYAGNKLALLVNLPKSSFDAFEKLLADIGNFTSSLFNFQTDTSSKFTNETISVWAKEKLIKVKIDINKIDTPVRYPKGMIEGAFLIQAISRKYDNLGG